MLDTPNLDSSLNQKPLGLSFLGRQLLRPLASTFLPSAPSPLPETETEMVWDRGEGCSPW